MFCPNRVDCGATGGLSSDAAKKNCDLHYRSTSIDYTIARAPVANHILMKDQSKHGIVITPSVN